MYEIAVAFLGVPVGSVAAERCFSLNVKVLGDDRQSIAERNLPIYNMLYDNSGSV